MKTPRLLLFMMVGLSLSIAGFARQARADVTSKEVKQNTMAADSAATNSEQERNNYVRQVQKEVNELSIDIDRLATKARTTRDTAKAEFDKEIKVLGEKRVTAEQKLSELQAANAAAWTQLKSGMDSAIEDLKRAFVKAKKEFE